MAIQSPCRGAEPEGFRVSPPREEGPVQDYADIHANSGIHKHVQTEQVIGRHFKTALFCRLFRLRVGGQSRRGFGSVLREESPVQDHADSHADPHIQQHVQAEQIKGRHLTTSLFGRLFRLRVRGRSRRGFGSVLREESPVQDHADLHADPGIHEHVQTEQARKRKLK
jgi:hypothetical protein